MASAQRKRQCLFVWTLVSACHCHAKTSGQTINKEATPPCDICTKGQRHRIYDQCVCAFMRLLVRRFVVSMFARSVASHLRLYFCLLILIATFSAVRHPTLINLTHTLIYSLTDSLTLTKIHPYILNDENPFSHSFFLFLPFYSTDRRFYLQIKLHKRCITGACRSIYLTVIYKWPSIANQQKPNDFFRTQTRW